MALTQDQLSSIPAVYQTFLEALWPVLNTSRPGPQMWISGVPLSRVYRALADEHGYSIEQVEELASNLEAAKLIARDDAGAYLPTLRGAELMESLARKSAEIAVPQFPPLEGEVPR